MIRKLFSMSFFSLVATFATFVFQIVATHTMIPIDYGVLAKWLTDLGYIGVFFTLGLDSSLLYYAKLGERIEENLGRNIISYSTILLLSIILIILLPVNKAYYFSLSITIFLLSISNVFCAYFQFYERFLVYNILMTLRPLLLLILFSLVFLNNAILPVNSTLWFYTLGVTISSTIILVVYLFNSFIKISKFNVFSFKYYKYGLKSILNKILSLFLYAACVYMLTYYSGYESVAYFFVASSISKMVWVIPDSAGNLLYPKFLKIKSLIDDKEAIKDMFLYAQIVFFINLVCLIIFALLGKLFLVTFYEKSYISSYIPALILLFGNQGMVYYKLISRYLASKNNWAPLYKSLIMAIMVNLILNYLLIPIYGLNGSAVASCLSFWACGIFIAFYVQGSFINFLDIRPVFRLVYNIIRRY